MNSSFEALGLSEALVRAVTELGYTTPTAIQQQAIPPALRGRDLRCEIEIFDTGHLVLKWNGETAADIPRALKLCVGFCDSSLM